MTTTERAPLVTCDCCGKQAEKRHNSITKKYERPDRWGAVKIPPKHWGAYPNHIEFMDVCPECIAEIHDAVSAAIDRRKKASAP